LQLCAFLSQVSEVQDNPVAPEMSGTELEAVVITVPVILILFGILIAITCTMCVFLRSYRRWRYSNVKLPLSAHNEAYTLTLTSPGIKPDPLEFPRSQLVLGEELGNSTASSWIDR